LKRTQNLATNQTRKLCDLDFADDIALLENTQESAQAQLIAFGNEASKVGLEINTDKTV
jgi:hypothetical protein